MHKFWILATLPLAACQAGGADPEAPKDEAVKVAAAPDNVVPLTIVSGQEVVVDEYEFEAGLDISTHKHPGVEIVHMLEGSTSLQLEGQAPMMLEAGDTFAIPADTFHRATVGDAVAKALVVRMHPSGEPGRIEPDGTVDFPE